jgi:chitinase
MGPEERWFAVDNVCLLRGEDTTPPAPVTGLKAEVKEGAALLSWQPAQDDVGVAGYVVYWSNVPQVRLDERGRLTQTQTPEFRHDTIPHPGTYYYAVSAVDLFGNVGKASDPVKVDLPG